MPFQIVWSNNLTTELQTYRIDTPVGVLLLRSSDEMLCAADWLHEANLSSVADLAPAPAHLQQIFKTYAEYPEASVALTLQLQGTLYQRKVWNAIAAIPFGQTRTYTELAAALQSGPRAVGNGCRTNPFPYIIPCHRVVSKQGIGGYSGHSSGLVWEFKKRLLDSEQQFLNGCSDKD